eukprot:7521280-Alexandrium_andersonii.AAC.1
MAQDGLGSSRVPWARRGSRGQPGAEKDPFRSIFAAPKTPGACACACARAPRHLRAHPSRR